MSLTDELLKSIPDGQVNKVFIGLNWTAVSIQINGNLYCGLSSTLRKPHAHGEGQDVPTAGSLTQNSVHELAEFCRSDQPTLASVGCAALNAALQAALQSYPLPYTEQNAEEIIACFGRGKRVAVVGHFPFTERVRQLALHLDVLENEPKSGDLPAQLAPEVLPHADVVALTGMTFVNHTLEPLLRQCSPGARVIVLGASTPLSAILFDYGVDYLCGALSKDVQAVLTRVAEGATYPQISKAGLKLVTIQKARNNE